MSALGFQIMADLTLLVHALFVLFVVLGLLLILVGAARGWTWVRGPLFRWLHLGAIAVVVSQAWLGRACPLTTLEMYFRMRGDEQVYSGSFIAYWIERLLYYDAPAWVFVLAYSLFAMLVIGCWVAVPPLRKVGAVLPTISKPADQ